MATPQMTCEECKGVGQLPAFSIGATTPTERCPWCSGSGQVDATFVVRSHCASGYVELETIVDTLDEAKAAGRKALERSPVTPCGTGGVRWVEIDGPGIEESIGIERHDGRLVETGC
jgi:hypothetical protein